MSNVITMSVIFMKYKIAKVIILRLIISIDEITMIQINKIFVAVSDLCILFKYK